MNDLLIRGAMLYDGSGAPGYVADVAVKDARIVSVKPAGVGSSAAAGSAANGATAKGGHTKINFRETLAVDSGRPVVVAALLHNSTNPRAQCSTTWMQSRLRAGAAGG